MKNKSTKEKYVTEEKFDKAMSGLHQKIDGSVERLDNTIGRLALSQVKLEERLTRVENAMATKSDINILINRFDDLSKKMLLFDTEERLQSIHINENSHRIENHEKRISALESPQ